MKQIYLDYAAATPLDSRVLSTMLPYLKDRFHNPSGTYLVGKSVANDVQTAREQVAKILGVKPAEIIFTAGGSEANNLAINGVMTAYPGSHLVISNIEHDSIRYPAGQHLVTEVEVEQDGRIDVDKLKSAISDKTVLISIILANNEIGTVQPISRIARLVKDISLAREANGNTRPLFFHTDASQAPNYLDMHINRLGVDLMTLNGGKIYGPKQSGMLFIRIGVQVSPVVRGGGQEHGYRSGTENTASIIGFSEALKLAQVDQSSSNKKVSKLRDDFASDLRKSIPNIQVNGSAKYRIANNLNITIPRIDNERVMMELDELGIQCAVGSACSASSDEPSHVLKAIGLSDEDAQSSLRFSLGKFTTAEDLKRVVKSLADIVKTTSP